MQFFTAFLAAASGLLTLTLADGGIEGEQTTNCALSRLCRHCTCHINGKYEQTIFCPGSDILLDSVVVMGTDNCQFPLEEGLLRSFRTKSLGLKDLGIRTLRNDTFGELSFGCAVS